MKIFRQLNSNSGSALVIVIFSMLILTILGAAIFSVSISESKSAVIYENRMQAHFAARSGADDIGNYIVENDGALPSINIGDSKELASESGEIFYVYKGATTVDYGYDITVEGNSRGTKDTVILEVIEDQSWHIFANAIYTNDNLDITRLQVNNGNVQSANDIAIETSGPHMFTGLTYPNSPINVAYTQLPVVVPSVPNYSPLDITAVLNTPAVTSSYHFDSITINNQTDFTIDVSGSNMVITVDDLTIDQQGVLNIIGDGKLFLYVDNLVVTGNIIINNDVNVELAIVSSFELHTPLTVNDNPNKLLIFLNNGAILSLHANAEIFGYIFGPDADIRIHSDASTINGAVISNFVLGSNNEQRPTGVVNYIQPDEELDVSEISVYRKLIYK